MYYPTNHVFSAFSFIAFILALIPLPWHLEAWNTGTCLFMIWTALENLNSSVNSIVWNGNVLNPAPVWCDISARIIVSASTAVPAATLCINRRLYRIASIRSVTVSREDKRQAVMVDLAIGLGIPFLDIALNYIIQDCRFYVLEDYGCYPCVNTTAVAVTIYQGVPTIIALVSAIYGVLTMRLFMKRRSHLEEVLSSNSGITSHRYLRLVCLASIDLLYTIPLNCFFLFDNVISGVTPWRSWNHQHSDISKIKQIPAAIWTSTSFEHGRVELSRWSIVFRAALILLFFGFAEEARMNYMRAFSYLAKLLGYGRSLPDSLSQRGPAALPVFVPDVRMRQTSFNSDFSFEDAGFAVEEESGSNEPPIVPFKTSSAPPLSNKSKGPQFVTLPEITALAKPEPTVQRTETPSARPQTSRTI